MKKLIITLIAIVFFSSLVNADVIINEIMYNPSGGDNNHEWIEIYNNGDEVNLEGWRFFENNQNHGLSLEQGDDMIISNDEYIIIVQDTDTFLEDYDYEGTILDSTFSLSNAGEYIALKDSNNEIVNEVEYSSEWGGEDGKSLEVINSNFDNNLQYNWDSSLEEAGTPGTQNSIFREQRDYSKVIDGNLWNFISFNIELFDNRPETVFSSLEELVMVKDEHGNFYQPGNRESTLEEIDQKEPYYVQLIGEEDTLEIQGLELNPNDYIFNFEAGENSWISYLLDEEMPIEEVFEDNIDDILLVKDGYGSFWAPEWNYNGLGNMIPGNGYVIITTNNFEFTYGEDRNLIQDIASLSLHLEHPLQTFFFGL